MLLLLLLLCRCCWIPFHGVDLLCGCHCRCHVSLLLVAVGLCTASARLFLDAIDKFFVGQQQEEPLLKAIADNLAEIEEGERRAEEKHNKFRLLAKDGGSTK